MQEEKTGEEEKKEKSNSLLTTTTMEMMEETSSNEGVDLISELPDSLLHYILSFLDMTYVFQTSSLSRRWRYVWSCVPILNFDHKVYDSCLLRSSSSFTGVQNFVDRVLYVRDQKSHIQAFRVLTNQEYYTTKWTRFLDSTVLNQVHRWIHLLVQQNVKELDIQLLEIIEDYSPYNIGFPNRLFTCKSLTKLTLGVISDTMPYGPPEYVLNLPDDDDDDDSVIMTLPALKTLHLKSFTYCTRKKSTRNFFSSVCCPVLETLIISSCRVKHGVDEELTISALQLKNLIIIDEYSGFNHSDYFEYGYSRIKVFAPKLMSFQCRDNKLNDYSFMDISSLRNAEIETIHGSHYYENCRCRIYKQQITLKKKYTDNVIRCLRAIKNVRSLVLSTWLLEDVYSFHNGRVHGKKERRVHTIDLASLLEEFWNLSFLKLRTSFSKDHYRVIEYLLEKCPNVETLVFERTKPPEILEYGEHQEKEEEFPEPKKDECSEPKKDESWKESLRWECKLHHLKVVEIHNVTGSPDELKFLQFLLMDAVVLEKMAVYTSGMKEAPNNDFIAKTFMEELVKLPRASSRPEISFI